MSASKDVGWATKMKSLLSLQQAEDDSSGSISPPTTDESGHEDDSATQDTDKEFESLFSETSDVKEVLQVKVEFRSIISNQSVKHSIDYLILPLSSPPQ
jgi:hypothetical protein